MGSGGEVAERDDLWNIPVTPVDAPDGDLLLIEQHAAGMRDADPQGDAVDRMIEREPLAKSGRQADVAERLGVNVRSTRIQGASFGLRSKNGLGGPGDERDEQEHRSHEDRRQQSRHVGPPEKDELRSVLSA